MPTRAALFDSNQRSVVFRLDGAHPGTGPGQALRDGKFRFNRSYSHNQGIPDFINEGVAYDY